MLLFFLCKWCCCEVLHIWVIICYKGWIAWCDNHYCIYNPRYLGHSWPHFCAYAKQGNSEHCISIHVMERLVLMGIDNCFTAIKKKSPASLKKCDIMFHCEMWNARFVSAHVSFLILHHCCEFVICHAVSKLKVTRWASSCSAPGLVRPAFTLQGHGKMSVRFHDRSTLIFSFS